MKKHHSFILLFALIPILFSCSQRTQEKDDNRLFGFFLGQVYADAKIGEQRKTESTAGEKIAFVQDNFTLKVNRQTLITMLRADSTVAVNAHFEALSPALLESMENNVNCFTERLRADIQERVAVTARPYGATIQLISAEKNIRVSEISKQNILLEIICRFLESGNFELIDNENNPVHDFFIGTVLNDNNESARGFLTSEKELFWVCMTSY